MTTLFSLAEAKSFLRVEYDDDDRLIMTLLQMAAEMIETRIRRPIVGPVGSGSIVTTASEIPASIKIAVFVIVSFMYEHRDASADEIRQRVMHQISLDQYINWSA